MARSKKEDPFIWLADHNMTEDTLAELAAEAKLAYNRERKRADGRTVGPRVPEVVWSRIAMAAVDAGLSPSDWLALLFAASKPSFPWPNAAYGTAALGKVESCRFGAAARKKAFLQQVAGYAEIFLRRKKQFPSASDAETLADARLGFSAEFRWAMARSLHLDDAAVASSKKAAIRFSDPALRAAYTELFPDLGVEIKQLWLQTQ